MSADRARSALVAGLRRDGRLRSAAVEHAFRTVPRHLFLPGVPLARAYADEAVAVASEGGVATSSASQPSMMAIMLEQLDLRPGQRVLEIGAGTGYNAALMARLVGPLGAVTAVDIDADLVASASAHLRAAGVGGVSLHCADGALGHAAAAPYDRIVLTVGSGDVRPEWIEQLAPGGRLLLPLSVRGSQLSVALDLGADGLLRSASIRSCAFIRLRGIGAEDDAALSLRAHGLPLDLIVAPDARSGTPGVDAAAVAAALTQPGPARPVGARLGPADLWDGFGLWLALQEAATVRLFSAAADGVARRWLPLGDGRVGLGLAVPAGLAVVEVEARGQRAALRGFGTGGAEAVRKLAGHLTGWEAHGRPTAAGLRLTAVPRGVPAPPAPPGAVTIAKPHCVLLAQMPCA